MIVGGVVDQTKPDDRGIGAEGDISVIYTTYISSIMTTEQRRSQVSAVYASLLAAALAALGFATDINLVFPALSILIISTLWYDKVKFLQSLARIKWQTALALEQRMVARPFTDEYAAIKKARGAGDHSRKRFSEMEAMLPRALQLLSAGYLLFRLAEWVLAAEWKLWETAV